MILGQISRLSETAPPKIWAPAKSTSNSILGMREVICVDEMRSRGVWGECGQINFLVKFRWYVANAGSCPIGTYFFAWYVPQKNHHLSRPKGLSGGRNRSQSTRIATNGWLSHVGAPRRLERGWEGSEGVRGGLEGGRRANFGKIAQIGRNFWKSEIPSLKRISEIDPQKQPNSAKNRLQGWVPGNLVPELQISESDQIQMAPRELQKS